MLGWFRKRILVTTPAEITFEVRGFETDNAPARPVLEMAALQFTVGFEFGIEYRTVEMIATRLETLEREYRGFAYEGATMACAVRDAMAPSRRRLTEELLSGPGSRYAFTACLGIGFGLARMPAAIWPRALPDPARLPDYPTTAWAALDGYGFHQAFFRTEQWVHTHRVAHGLGRMKPERYARRIVDQGIGRALWFVSGGNVDRLVALVDGFAADRRPDLWSGVGLAASYAGGVGSDALETLVDRAEEHRSALALGATLAIEARVLSDLVTPHTELAAAVLCARPVGEVHAIAGQAMRDLSGTSATPAYGVFRQRIQSHFA
jgi:hypothetical protein